MIEADDSNYADLLELTTLSSLRMLLPSGTLTVHTVTQGSGAVVVSDATRKDQFDIFDVGKASTKTHSIVLCQRVIIGPAHCYVPVMANVASFTHHSVAWRLSVCITGLTL